MNQWIQQLYINPNAVCADSSFFSPLLSPPLFLLPRSLGRIQTKRHLCRLASLPETQTATLLLLLLLFPSTSSSILLLLLTVAELPGLWKINLQRRWISQEHASECKYGRSCEWRGRFKIEREQVWKAGEMRSTTSVFMCVCEHLYKLDASTSCRFLISVVMQMLARLLLLSRCWASKCIPHPAGFFLDTPKALLDI